MVYFSINNNNNVLALLEVMVYEFMICINSAKRSASLGFVYLKKSIYIYDAKKWCIFYENSFYINYIKNDISIKKKKSENVFDFFKVHPIISFFQ